jgi:hypothetical protein
MRRQNDSEVSKKVLQIQTRPSTPPKKNSPAVSVLTSVQLYHLRNVLRHLQPRQLARRRHLRRFGGHPDIKKSRKKESNTICEFSVAKTHKNGYFFLLVPGRKSRFQNSLVR